MAMSAFRKKVPVSRAFEEKFMELAREWLKQEQPQ